MVGSSQLMSACTARQQHIVPLPPLCTRLLLYVYFIFSFHFVICLIV